MTIKTPGTDVHLYKEGEKDGHFSIKGPVGGRACIQVLVTQEQVMSLLNVEKTAELFDLLKETKYSCRQKVMDIFLNDK